MKYKVLADYEVNDPHPLQLEAGEKVKILQKDLGWPGWVWVDVGDQSGWIPESFLKEADATFTKTAKAFDGKELSARRGDLLSVKETAPGWIYGEGETGEMGWFPLFNLKPFRST